jgi:hypothetical protein
MRALRNMASKSDPKPDDEKQSERFIKAAKEAGADETERGADKAFRKVALPKSRSKLLNK